MQQRGIAFHLALYKTAPRIYQLTPKLTPRKINDLDHIH